MAADGIVWGIKKGETTLWRFVASFDAMAPFSLMMSNPKSKHHEWLQFAISTSSEGTLCDTEALALWPRRAGISWVSRISPAFSLCCQGASEVCEQIRPAYIRFYIWFCFYSYRGDRPHERWHHLHPRCTSLFPQSSGHANENMVGAPVSKSFKAGEQNSNFTHCWGYNG